MKSYGQLCAVAQSLDLIGDRWTLLVVRELLIQGSLRFGELQRGLPGIATNLLTQRLRYLEDHDVVAREQTAGVMGLAVYRLTERGEALEGVIRELLKWGAPMVPAASPEAAFQMHWLSQPARYLLQDHRPQEPGSTIRFGTVEDGFDLTAADGMVSTAPCSREAEIRAIVSGPGSSLVALFQGILDLAAAKARGVEVQGDVEALSRVLP